ncbi:MAG TPA: hypothetical protein PLX33_12360 [Alphaproteobacteria bacterium]|nr:hypothetical protein [Alphaproteobacteria bacterium]
MNKTAVKTWTAISGSWRTVNGAVESDVRATVAGIITAGGGIVTGGALGVDYIATDEALKHAPDASRLKIILPTSLSDYANHYFKKAGEGVITPQQAQSLIAQLRGVKDTNPAALTEMHHTVCTPETYYDRNTAVLAAADNLAAFQVNGSAGTQDTIDKAQARGMPVLHKKYIL